MTSKIGCPRKRCNGKSLPSIARKVLSRFVQGSGKDPDTVRTGGLTERELEFLRLMARGLSNKEIASEVNLSIRTVQGSLGQIFKKLGVGSRTEAVIHALKEGLVTLDEVPQAEAGQTPEE